MYNDHFKLQLRQNQNCDISYSGLVMPIGTSYSDTTLQIRPPNALSTSLTVYLLPAPTLDGAAALCCTQPAVRLDVADLRWVVNWCGSDKVASEVGLRDPAWNCRCCNNTDRVKARKGFLLLNTRQTWQTSEVQLAVFQAPTQSDMAATAESTLPRGFMPLALCSSK